MPDARPLDQGKPRDEDTEGGDQPADKSLINRRLSLRSQLCAASDYSRRRRSRRTDSPVASKPLTANIRASKWNMTAALVKLFNRIIEDRISVSAMRTSGGQWARLADLYDEYRAKLQAEHRCDFSHLQLQFLEFLQTPLGRRFRDGDSNENVHGIRWVLVDEYQDTNLIQEEIYLTLANRQPFNVVVVGDDNQALYRFRGGSVECMVTFDQACAVFLGVPPGSVARYPLVANFRSHVGIVTFCEDYITAFASMAVPGARVPNKPALVPRSAIAGNYPSVGQLRAASMDALAGRVAETIHDLVANSVVQDYSQCCLLL